MPELPDLTVLREILRPRLVGASIVEAEVRRPIPVRNLLGGDVREHLVGRRFCEVGRRGKFLLMPLDGGPSDEGFTSVIPSDEEITLVINPMLAGRIRHGAPLGRHRKRDVLVLDLDDGTELRYHDAKDMGKVYLADDLSAIPTYADQGPEADDPAVTLELFRQRIRRHRGEIKWILTNQRFLAGIGNAYADEILWRAGLYPFRRRPSLDDEQIATLYASTREVLSEAIETLRERNAATGGATDVEFRDFLAVHGKPGEPCPRCGSTVSEVKRERRATHFCRTCQPGSMFDR
jgi:formamidopyrimidine-DNA glycosylase